MDIQGQLQRLLDIEAIRDLPRRYANCIWGKDAAGAASLFTEDGFMDSGRGEPIRGRAVLTATFTHAFDGSISHPFVHNHVIELSGDTATGVCHLDLRVIIGDKVLISSADYQDVYVRQGGTWLFQSRKLRMHYQIPVTTSSTQIK